MKFKNIKNYFAPEITEIEITDKELSFMGMITSGVGLLQALEILCMSIYDLHIFYNKLGLTDRKKIRHMQATTIFAINDLISSEILFNLYKKYELIECKKMAEFTLEIEKEEGKKHGKRKFKIV